MFSGSMVALVTPFRNDKVDWACLDKLVDMHVQTGTDALVPCGTTGESPTLSYEEHEQVIEAVIKRAAGKIPILAGTGSNSTAEAVFLTRHARDAGASGSLQVAPYYNKPTQEGLYLHFGSIAEECGDFPMVLYNIPGRCGVEISVATIARLHKDYPSIVGVKHATGSIDGASELLAACPDIEVYSGDDSMTFPLMALGGKGVISVIANLIPKEVKAMTAPALAGNWSEARKQHFALFGLAKAMLSLETNPIPIKTAMALKGMIAEEFRLPMCKMAAGNKEKLRAIMTQAGLL
jgi:4-hydroxy-tetrahydrodipicolinate synthase